MVGLYSCYLLKQVWKNILHLGVMRMLLTVDTLIIRNILLLANELLEIEFSFYGRNSSCLIIEYAFKDETCWSNHFVIQIE